MKKPTEPTKPYKPYKQMSKVRINLDQREEGAGYDDLPHWPSITLESFASLCETNEIETEGAEIVMEAGSHVYEMMLIGHRTSKSQATYEKDYKARLKEYNRRLDKYTQAKEKYDDDLRAYYQWELDSI